PDLLAQPAATRPLPRLAVHPDDLGRPRSRHPQPLLLPRYQEPVLDLYDANDLCGVGARAGRQRPRRKHSPEYIKIAFEKRLALGGAALLAQRQGLTCDQASAPEVLR